MKNSTFKRLTIQMVALLFAFAIGAFAKIQAQTCNTNPSAAGFHTAGGFGGCLFNMKIVYDCGSGPVITTCLVDGSTGFDLPAGCCLMSVSIQTPQQGWVTVDPNIPNGNISVPLGGWTYIGDPCNDHPVSDIHWNFGGGPCRVGEIHIN